jgi:hypothetical protein
MVTLEVVDDRWQITLIICNENLFLKGSLTIIQYYSIVMMMQLTFSFPSIKERKGKHPKLYYIQDRIWVARYSK